MSFAARVVEDSWAHGVRAVTFELTFPRFILAEVNTHRMLSRNSASSRAIPPELQIKRVRTNPFVPLTFNKRVKGMGVGMALDDADTKQARTAWLNARTAAVESAEILTILDCDKSRINRLLEPFLWHTAIVTGTEWSNFFALRLDEGAQPEFRLTAGLMQRAMRDSLPRKLKPGEWHLPFVTLAERGAHEIAICKDLSARRCARVSFDKHTDVESLAASLEKIKPLKANGHVSPMEHQLRALADNDLRIHDERLMVPVTQVWNTNASVGYPSIPLSQVFCGNTRGFWQYRKEIEGEADFGRGQDPLALPGPDELLALL